MSTLHVGNFLVESLGVEYPDYFQGYGLGPQSKFQYCAYGIGNTEEEALADCLEMVAQQGFNVDEETEEQIREGYGPVDENTTVAAWLGVDEFEDCPAYFRVGMKWNCREEERLERIRKLANLEMEGADEAWESWVAGNFRRALDMYIRGVGNNETAID